MCGIVGAVAQRDVSPILLEGLKRLEYRGYDSAGIAVIDDNKAIQRQRTLGKVNELEQVLTTTPLVGHSGIAHTRWATHGEPSEQNAHPHMSGDDIALVHNGIIENHQVLKSFLLEQGYTFYSETDTEIIVHLFHHCFNQEKGALQALFAMAKQLEGAFALALIYRQEPNRLLVVRKGSPLVIGIGVGEHFIASDPLALAPVTQQFIYLKEGDVADITINDIKLYDLNGDIVERAVQTNHFSLDKVDRGDYKHFMLKEIFEQSQVIADTLEERIVGDKVVIESFGYDAANYFKQAKRIKIVACGTSYHAGMVARYWLEQVAQLPCQVEVASEFRYRQPVIEPDTLLILISQSGETADTLAVLKASQQQNYLARLAICNVPESSLVREADLVFMTRAGIEIGVASTKAFTTQLTSLLLLTIALAEAKKIEYDQTAIVGALRKLPDYINQVLALQPSLEKLSYRFVEKHHALFLGRGVHYPVAMEGALKLKEISYIHAEAYPAGELKHGPLALVDKDMPVIAVAPNNTLLEKLKSNLFEVSARGGELIVFVDEAIDSLNDPTITSISMPTVPDIISPIVYTVPLQFLAYYSAIQKGTDIDQPRNLAKSVTVE